MKNLLKIQESLIILLLFACVSMLLRSDVKTEPVEEKPISKIIRNHFTSTSSTIIQAFSPALGCHSGSVP